MAKKNNNEFRLAVGDLVIGLICPSEDYAESMMNYFGVASSKKKPDIRLTLNPIPHNNIIKIPNSLFTTKVVRGSTFNISNNLVSGNLKKDGSGEINFKECLAEGQLTRVFEQLLYQAFYSACKIKKNNAFLVHSSGAIYRNKGFLFFGPSGSGKSTVANLSRKHHVLNDEICLISNKGDKVYLNYTPYNGFYTDKKQGYAPLKAIFYLKHGISHKIADIKKSEAIKLLAKEIVPPISLTETIKSSTFMDMLNKAERLYDKVDIKKLVFLPDGGFWDEIDKINFKAVSHDKIE